MITLNAANNAFTQLASSISDTATTLTVTSSAGFPAPPFVATIGNEIVRVIAVNGTTWTVVRAQEGTTAQAWDVGTLVELRWTAGMYNEIKNAVNNPRGLYKYSFIILTLFGSLSGTSKWYGGVLAPNGKIYCVPHNATQVLEIDPETKELTLFGSLSGTSKWLGGVLAPNGKIYCVPHNATQALEINPETKELTLFGDLSGTSKWIGGVLAPNGKIYCVPHNATQVLEMSVFDLCDRYLNKL